MIFPPIVWVLLSVSCLRSFAALARGDDFEGLVDIRSLFTPSFVLDRRIFGCMRERIDVVATDSIRVAVALLGGIWTAWSLWKLPRSNSAKTTILRYKSESKFTNCVLNSLKI